MTVLQVILTILVAILVGILFYYIFKTSGPWGTFWSFLLILILGGLAAAAWVEPVGPVYYDVAWIPTLFVILMFALFLAAATPSYRRDARAREAARAEAETEPVTTEPEGAIVGAFFWVLLIFLLIAAIWGVFV